MRMQIEGCNHDFGGDVFIDIGANVGMWSSKMVDLYNKIIYVEPGTYAMNEGKNLLQRVCAEKQVDFNNIIFLKNACSLTPGEQVSLSRIGGDSGNLSVYAKELYGTQSDEQEENVETITLDSLESLVGNSTNIFIKIDTEGCDVDILLGGLNFIKKYKPTIFVEAHFHMHFEQDKWNTVLNFMNSQGYNLEEFKMPNYLHEATRMFGNCNGRQMYDLHYQMIFIPNKNSNTFISSFDQGSISML